jgi:hypothetical protein
VWRSGGGCALPVREHAVLGVKWTIVEVVWKGFEAPVGLEKDLWVALGLGESDLLDVAELELLGARTRRVIGEGINQASLKERYLCKASFSRALWGITEVNEAIWLLAGFCCFHALIITRAGYQVQSGWILHLCNYALIVIYLGLLSTQ